MYKTLYMGHDNERKALEELFGHFNDFPPGWTELSPQEFAKSQLLGGVVNHIERRQLMRPATLLPMGVGYVEAQLYHTGNGIGYAVSANYHKGTVQFFKFDCFNKLQSAFASLLVVSDSGWVLQSSSIPRRGIMDYKRTIEFARALSEREWELTKMFLARDNCPGWTGISSHALGKSYTFTTTHDSSD
jgi:hypothetical protein